MRYLRLGVDENVAILAGSFFFKDFEEEGSFNLSDTKKGADYQLLLPQISAQDRNRTCTPCGTRT